ncbi:group XIIA secretory phospholipase A2 [Bacillus rossius redtenbacheri]|uniref:group XIIA secretory phospholipase A2 n=1 Tax=Bacillus rossius redtenbacheri TaxID=93214 RepID=UPI002FDD8A02
MEIPKMKIFIYALTFLGYAWSGYGSGIINNLKDAVLAAEHVFSDVLQNVITVAKKFRDFHDVFNAAVEEDCKFKCPGDVKPVKNKFHTPSSNGCGSLGVEISNEYLPVGDMTSCCDEHDLCYDTCNSGKELCDYEFKSCLYKICDKYGKSVGNSAVTTCKTATKLLFVGTLALGCKSYLDSQQQACYCKPGGKKRYSGAEL